MWHSWSLAWCDASLTTDKQQTTWLCHADTDKQTYLKTQLCRRQTVSRVGAGTKKAKEQTCECNLSFLSLSISNTTTHMSVNGAMSRVPSGTLSSTTHGVHHFLSNSPFPIVNTHLCTIRRASSRLTHTHTHTRTHRLLYLHLHTYSTYKHTSA